MKSATHLIPFIDYTSLSEQDNPRSIANFVEKVMQLHDDGFPRVASVCVYPPFIENVGIALGNSDISISAVCGGFPSGQTFLEVKMLEVAMAIENGADELDVVINIGGILSGDYDIVGAELEIIAEEIDHEAILKVIIESGILNSPELIHRASMIAMESGADFIKTSSGKTSVGATPEAIKVMCEAIKEFHMKTGKKVGIKVAGGVNESAQAEDYLNIVRLILGNEWITPNLFRIGASNLLDNIIKESRGSF